MNTIGTSPGISLLKLSDEYTRLRGWLILTLFGYLTSFE
jgi:hypothetical protein